MRVSLKPAGLLAAAALAVLAGCGHSAAGSSQSAGAAAVRAEQARDLARQAGLGPDVQAFMARAAGAGGATFTAVYDLGGGQRSIVMQRPPSRRVDLQGVTSPTGVERYLVLRTGTFHCHGGDGAWTCRRAGDAPPVGAFAPESIGAAVAALSQSTAAYDFAIRPRRIAGVGASCLSTTLKPDHPADPSLGVSGEMCIAPSGAVLALSGSQNAAVAVAYSASVPADAFDLPARPAP